MLYEVITWGFVDGKPIKNQLKNHKNAPATTAISDDISKDLKKRGFKFVGSTVVYAHMQATGIVITSYSIHYTKLYEFI